MAIKTFGNTYDLVNHLCQENVLGELTISFSQDAPYPSFNFDYSDLEEHLDSVLFDMTDRIAGVPAYELTFLDADDWDIEAEDNDDYSGLNLTNEINQSIGNIIKKELQIEAFASMNIEGNEFNADNFKVNRFDVYNWKDQKAPLEINPELRRKLLVEIADILQRMNLQLETISHFYLDNSAGSDYISFSATGSPYFSGHLDLDDEEEFTLDTEKLKPRI